MKISIALVALIALNGGWVWSADATVLTGRTQVVVVPFEGHPGDRAYLSVSGFPPHRAVSVLLACPHLHAPQSSESFTAARTDAHGQILAYRVTVFRPRGSGPIRCAFYAGLSGGRLDRAVPAPYVVVPVGRPLAAGATHIAVRVTASLVRLRSGAQGSIAVTGWPGARAVVRIVSPGTRTLTRTLRLGWHGSAAFRLQVAPGLLKGVQARVQARVSLGQYRGSGTAHFIVVPGGR